MAVYRHIQSELADYNNSLDSYCRTHWGITVGHYKTVKATTQLVGVTLGFYAILEGADPLQVYGLIAFIIGGPEALEYAIANGEDKNE